MVELVVLACLMAGRSTARSSICRSCGTMAVADCVTKQPTFEIVQWATEHPGWTIKKWTCGPPRA